MQTQVQFITVPLHFVGEAPESRPFEPSRALERLRANHKHVEPLGDYIANLLGFSSWHAASSSGVQIVCLDTKMWSPQKIHTLSEHHPHHQDLVVCFVEFATCRFYDPNRSRGVNHLGFHPDNIKAFVQNDKFKPFLQTALNKLDNAAKHIKNQESFTCRSAGCSFDPRVVCVTYCNRGRHRSVSASEVLQEVLAKECQTGVFSVLQSCI
jgi:hypothetical protein